MKIKSHIESSINLRVRGGILHDRTQSSRNFPQESRLFYRTWYLRELIQFLFGRHAPKTITDGDAFFDRYHSVINILGIKLPKIKKEDRWLFWYEFYDLILPYILEKEGEPYRFKIIDDFLDEGPYELDENVAVKPNDIVFDCGGNFGVFSAISSLKGAKVYCFEPSKTIRVKYTNKTAKLHKNIQIVPYGLGQSDNMVEFYINPDNIAASRIANGHMNENKFKKEMVNITSLDKFVQVNNIAHVDFIKSDIEGAERDMLIGARKILKNMHPKLSICTYHLPDDKVVLENIVREANPDYVIKHKYAKMYAYVPAR